MLQMCQNAFSTNISFLLLKTSFIKDVLSRGHRPMDETESTLATIRASGIIGKFNVRPSLLFRGIVQRVAIGVGSRSDRKLHVPPFVNFHVRAVRLELRAGCDAAVKGRAQSRHASRT